MRSSYLQRALPLGAAFSLANAVAIPDATAAPEPAQADAPAAAITPAAIQFKGANSYMVNRRDIFDDIKNEVGDVVESWGSVLGTDLPSYFTDGIPEWFQSLPTGTEVLEDLGIGDELAAKPTEVLNIPPYANWTDEGWNVRFHGNVYKFPDISQEEIDDKANDFLIGVDIDELPEDQQENARNLTRSIYIVQQGDEEVSMYLEPAPMQGSSGEPGGGNSIEAPGGAQNVTLPYNTTDLGDYDVFVPIQNVSGSGLLAGNETDNVQRLNVYAHGTLSGNATAFLVPPEGITILSDIDDILRVTKIYDPKEGLLNSFARDFRPWMNMPEIYANWSQTLPNSTHFHYLTTTPEQATRNYMDFIYKTYPGGSFDTRPLNFSDISVALSIRQYLLNKVFETFPQRKFVLVADTSNSDVMSDYPQLAHDHPDQVQCIFLRNTSATDSDNWFPYDTSGFEGLKSNSYMFFRVPDDLRGLDIANGQCLNNSIPQNVTFSTQAEILGLENAGEALRSTLTTSLIVAVMTALSVFM